MFLWLMDALVINNNALNVIFMLNTLDTLIKPRIS